MANKVLNEWAEDYNLRLKFQKVFARSPYNLGVSKLVFKFDLKDISNEWRKKI